MVVWGWIRRLGWYYVVELSPSQLLLFAFSHYSSPSISACFFAIIPLILFSARSSTILSLLYPSPGVCTFWSSWGEGGTPPCEYPLAFGNIPLMVFFWAHPFTNPGIPILPLCVLNSPLFPYRYPNVFHARFAPCSLLCMLLSTNKCPNLPPSLALHIYLPPTENAIYHQMFRRLQLSS